jgi:glycogen operon protein
VRTAKNILATVLLSAGIPMFAAGDECGRTQRGNNNAYCQDNILSWFDWSPDPEWASVRQLAQTLLRLRAEHPTLRPKGWRWATEVRDANGHGLGRNEVAWFAETGWELGEAEWHDGGRRTLGLYVSDADTALLAVFHAGNYPLAFTLPECRWASAWSVVSHTGTPDEFPVSQLSPGQTLDIPPLSVAVLQGVVADTADLEGNS